MMKKKSDKFPTYPVPFSGGGLHSYPDWYSLPIEAKKETVVDYCAAIPERDAFKFVAELEYQTYGRGRSSAIFWWKSVAGEENGKWFPVQMANMSSFIPHIKKGKIYGEFLTRKQGTNFGIELVKPL